MEHINLRRKWIAAGRQSHRQRKVADFYALSDVIAALAGWRSQSDNAVTPSQPASGKIKVGQEEPSQNNFWWSRPLQHSRPLPETIFRCHTNAVTKRKVLLQ